MSGYEPFLLCDFHVHTRWSDGRLSVRDVVDLYGRTGKFDVIAITDHILMNRDLLKRAGRIASLGLKKAISDAGLAEGVNVYDGKITYKAVAESQGRDYTALDQLL